MIIKILILCVLFAGAVIDFKYRKIPNYITFPMFFLGVVYNIVHMDETMLSYMIFNILITIIVFAYGYCTKNIGAGDVKMFLAVSGWVSSEVFIAFLFQTMLFGALAAGYKILKNQGVYGFSKYSLIFKIITGCGEKIPLGVCMFLGFMTSFFYR